MTRWGSRCGLRTMAVEREKRTRQQRQPRTRRARAGRTRQASRAATLLICDGGELGQVSGLARHWGVVEARTGWGRGGWNAFGLRTMAMEREKNQTKEATQERAGRTRQASRAATRLTETALTETDNGQTRAALNGTTLLRLDLRRTNTETNTETNTDTPTRRSNANANPTRTNEREEDLAGDALERPRGKPWKNCHEPSTEHRTPNTETRNTEHGTRNTQEEHNSGAPRVAHGLHARAFTSHNIIHNNSKRKA